MALHDLAAGRAEDVRIRLVALNSSPPGTGHPLVTALVSSPDLVEASVRIGRVEDARSRACQFLGGFASPGAPPWALALAGRCRALMAPDPTVGEAEYMAALRAHAKGPRPFDRRGPNFCSASIFGDSDGGSTRANISGLLSRPSTFSARFREQTSQVRTPRVGGKHPEAGGRGRSGRLSPTTPSGEVRRGWPLQRGGGGPAHAVPSNDRRTPAQRVRQAGDQFSHGPGSS